MHLRWAFGVGVFCIGLGFGTRIFTQKPHSIHIAVSGLKLSLPATWRVTRNSANPILVTAVSPMSKINLTITYTPSMMKPNRLRGIMHDFEMRHGFGRRQGSRPLKPLQ